MASIGDVTATLKADIGQYVGPMQQAADATKAVQQSVEQATTSLLKEGAAGSVAGKGLADVGTGAGTLAEQLAAAEGRVTQLNAAFAALGIPAKGNDFAKATAEVSRLKAELIAAGGAAPDLGPALEVPLKKVAPAAQGAAVSANHLRASLASLASSAAGIPGPLGNIASRFLMFGAGGPVTIGVLAGLAAISLAWSKWRENVEKETARAAEIWERTQARMRGRDAFIGLVEEREEATKRLKKANEEIARIQAIQQRPGGTIAGGRDDLAQGLAAARLEADAATRSLQALDTTIQEVARDRRDAQDALQMAGTTGETARATLEHTQALRALAQINAEVAAATNATVEQLQAQASATDRVRLSEETLTRLEQERLGSLRVLGRDLSANADLFGGSFLLQSIERTQKQLEVQRQLKTELAATAEIQRSLRAAGEAKQVQEFKSDSTLKDSIRQSGQDAEETMRSVAGTLSRAFVNAFGDTGKSITERITSVLGAALRDAVEKLVAQKIFEPLLNGLFNSSSKSDGGSLLGNVVGGIIGGLLATPNAPTLSMPAPESSATIVVPLDNLPKPLGPVEMARDAMHMAVWVETARQAQANGVRLQPRFA